MCTLLWITKTRATCVNFPPILVTLVRINARFYSVIERERKTEIERRRDEKEDETSVRGPLRGPPGIQVTARERRRRKDEARLA